MGARVLTKEKEVLRHFAAVVFSLAILFALTFPLGYMGPSGNFVLAGAGLLLGYFHKEIWNFTLGRKFGKVEKKKK